MGTALTALVAEDEAMLADVMAWALEDAGYEVIHAVNGQAALELLSQQHVDVLVTDIRMPLMDGLTLANRARQSSASLPIVFVSGFSAESAAMPDRSVFLRKPFSPDDLTRAIERVL